MSDGARRARFDSIVTEAYQPLQRYLRRRCAPDDVDDVLNAALTVIWHRVEQIPPDLVLPWCYGVARRCLANHHRGNRRRLQLVERLGRTADAPALEFVTDADAALHEALAGLTDTDRELVRLWAWERLEPREIAAVLDTTPNAVSIRLTRVRTELRSALTRKDPAPAGHQPQRDEEELQP